MGAPNIKADEARGLAPDARRFFGKARPSLGDGVACALGAEVGERLPFAGDDGASAVVRAAL